MSQMNYMTDELQRQPTTDWQPVRIIVRGHIVPSAAAIERRRAHGGKSRRKRTTCDDSPELTDQEAGADVDAQRSEAEASQHLLSPEEEQQAVAILGPRPWYSLALDCETVVTDMKSWPDAPQTLRIGQPLRVAYYELRGISEWEIARRLRDGTLVPKDRHQLRQAGFVLPDANEQIALDTGTMIPLYAGYTAQLKADRAIVQEYCALHLRKGGYRRIFIRGKQEFIKEVLYRYAYGYRRESLGARLIGHQFFFDITRFVTDVMTSHGVLIRGVRRGAKWAKRGVSLKLCDCPNEDCGFHPRIRVVKLGRFKHRFAFEKTSVPSKDAARDGTKRRKRSYPGRFLDTIPFGLALRKCKSAKLEAMGEIFDAQVKKRPHPDFAGPLTEEYLDYLVGDVQAAYWLSVAEQADYQRLGLSRSPESIYSTASLAKGFQHAFGFPRTKQRRWHLDLPACGYSTDDIQGFAAMSYFGGRAEVHYRARPSEVLHVDYKSQYIAIGHRMGLQRFWLTKDVSVRDCTQEIITWLTTRTPEELLVELGKPETWPRLCVLVQIVPDGRLTLPVRADFQQNVPHPSGVYNIGQAYVRSKTPLWYTLPDVLAGVIRDKVRPTISQAVVFVPSADQVETRPVEIAGTLIDPSRDVVWTKFIDLRRSVKHQADDALASGNLSVAGQLTGQQNALKETALAASYGIAEELNEKIYEGKALRLDVYALGRTKRYGNVVEEPGPYFAGALGTLIPAGGRLLLAMAEQLLCDRGLSYVFMDTDSITPFRPAGMAREDFVCRVQEVVQFFEALNPYQEGGSLLAYEDQNYAIDAANPNSVDNHQLEPLGCLATSAKRYVEYNHWYDADGRLHIRLRKFTSHGLGQWGRRDQDEYTLPDYMDPPQTFREKKDEQGQIVRDADGNPPRVPDSTPLGGPLWIYRLQWDFVYTMLTGHYPNGDPLYIDAEGVPWYFIQPEEWLQEPAFYQFSVETWADYQRLKHLPGMRPGGFITVYPSPNDPHDPLSRIVLGDEVVQPDDGASTAGDSVPGEEQEETEAARLDTAIAESLLSPDSTALYSPYVTSGAEAAQALARGDVRRVSDDTSVAPGTMLKTMYEVVVKYFAHGEAKAANPYGAGELARRQVDAVGIDVTSKESNRLAQSAAEDTANVVGGREQFGSRDYGPTEAVVHARSVVTRLGQLSSLFDEEMPDLLAASCLSRRTIDNVRHGTHEPSVETWAALELAMQLLNPAHSQSIAGWRDIIAPDELAQLLAIPLQDARKRVQGQQTWRETERAQLILFLTERRARLADF
ncbi:MAG: hypothetical protein ACLQUY_20985 [Ktedonobacterales bacterium]